MRFLVTGGAGFIGSNLCEELLKQGYLVVCFDNFSTGKRENINSFSTHPNFKLFEGDIRNVEDCKLACANADVVLHEAALGSVPRSINDPITTNDVNVGGFVTMLFAAKEAGVKRFIYASSSTVYGDYPELPMVEDIVGKPLSPYAITKYTNELYAANFAKIYGMKVIGLRYFNVFGRKQDSQDANAAVIPRFVKQLIEHKSPVINGDGTHSRDFTHIDNVVKINLLAAKTNNPMAINQVYNVACGENNTLNELVAYLKKHLSKKDETIATITTINGPERVGDVKHTLADISKVKELLLYEPTYTFDKGLKEAVDWYWESLK
jgi:UDP-N-acetylglucosamine 4-epimerase